MLEVCVLLAQCYLTDVKFTPREAAIQRCNAQARSLPKGKYYDWDGVWNMRYSSCMAEAGQVP